MTQIIESNGINTILKSVIADVLSAGCIVATQDVNALRRKIVQPYFAEMLKYYDIQIDDVVSNLQNVKSINGTPTDVLQYVILRKDFGIVMKNSSDNVWLSPTGLYIWGKTSKLSHAEDPEILQAIWQYLTEYTPPHQGVIFENMLD